MNRLGNLLPSVSHMETLGQFLFMWACTTFYSAKYCLFRCSMFSNETWRYKLSLFYFIVTTSGVCTAVLELLIEESSNIYE